jgi:hypothetical protein
MPRRRTRAEVEIEAKLQALDPATKRFRVLSAVRDFKASWVAVGEELTEVRESSLFEEWGYTNFETYCRRELRIKDDTANKLTRSFSFLRDHEPQALDERQQRELPPLDVVDLLSQARERAQVAPNELDTIRREVFDPEAGPVTRGQVVKRFREVDPDAFRPPPRSPKPNQDEELRKALLLAERLQSIIEALPRVSREAMKNVRALAAELRERFDKTRSKSA